MQPATALPTRSGIVEAVLRRLAPSAPLFLAVGWFVAAVLVSANSGFQGEDDLRYWHGAQAWVAGPHLPGWHFETRIPYLLAIRAWGLSEAALLSLHISLCVLLIGLSWRLARPMIGREAAAMFVLVLAGSPFLLQAAGTLQLEAFELPLCAAAFWLVRHRLAGAGRSVLIGAGALLGLALITRETAAGTALGVGLALLARRRVADCVVLAGIAVIPVLIEMATYKAVTGDFLYRYRIDMAHVLGANPQLQGLVYKDGPPIFSPTLESRWITPSLLHVHWTVDPFLRLITHPATMSIWLPAFAVLACGQWALRAIGRDLAVDIGLVILSVYVVTVFVLSLAPAPRYFDVASYLMALLLGCGLGRLSRRHRMAAWACIAALLISARPLADLTPSARPEVPFLVDTLRHYDETLYTTGLMADAGYLQLRKAGWLDRVKALPPGGAAPPIGALYLAERQTNEIALQESCPDGQQAYRMLVQGNAALPMVWQFIRTIDLPASMPHALRAVVASRLRQPALYRRQC